MFVYALGAAIVLLAGSPLAFARGLADTDTGGSSYYAAGTVVNSLTGEPMKRALVMLSYVQRRTGDELPPEPVTQDTLTDETGSFQFNDLPAGTYLLGVNKPHFVNDTSGDRTFVLGPSRRDIKLRMTPLAVVEGSVLDSGGEPVAGAQIQAIKATIRQGARETQPWRTVSTDDRGRYRLWNLEEGKYYLKATGRSGGTRSYLGENAPTVEWRQSFEPTYHGGGHTLNSATPVSIKPGDRVQADLKLALRTSFRIQGSITNFHPFEKTRLEVRTSAGELVACRVAVNEATGRFEVNDIVPGAYSIRVAQGNGDNQVQGEHEFLISGSDIRDVTVPLSRGSNVSVLFHCSDPQGIACRGFVRIVRTDGTGTYYATPGSNGEFTIQNVMAGEYSPTVDAASGYATAVTWAGAAVAPGGKLVVSNATSDGILEVWIQSDGGNIQGIVDPGVLQSGLHAVLVPQVPSLAGSRVATVRADGRFNFHMLAPGDYTLICIPSNSEIEYANREVLRRISGQNVRVAARSTLEVILRSVAQ